MFSCNHQVFPYIDGTMRNLSVFDTQIHCEESDHKYIPSVQEMKESTKHHKNNYWIDIVLCLFIGAAFGIMFAIGY